VRLSGLGVQYPAPIPPAGQRAPDLDLRDAPAATIFGLLHRATFVLLNLKPAPAAPAAPSGFPDRLTAVTAQLAGDHPEWDGVRTMLIRPDGYIAWSSHDDCPPPLDTWLGDIAAADPCDTGSSG
jgi:bifunctional hydroxylase/dehydrase